MRRTIEGLRAPNNALPCYPEGRMLAAVKRVVYIHSAKPYFAITFRVLEPVQYAGSDVTTKLYCTNRALWKLQWFLRDFSYDPQLLAEDQIDEKALIGLKGVIQIARESIAGRVFMNIKAFGPSSSW